MRACPGGDTDRGRPGAAAYPGPGAGQPLAAQPGQAPGRRLGSRAGRGSLPAAAGLSGPPLPAAPRLAADRPGDLAGRAVADRGPRRGLGSHPGTGLAAVLRPVRRGQPGRTGAHRGRRGPRLVPLPPRDQHADGVAGGAARPAAGRRRGAGRPAVPWLARRVRPLGARADAAGRARPAGQPSGADPQRLTRRQCRGDPPYRAGSARRRAGQAGRHGNGPGRRRPPARRQPGGGQGPTGRGPHLLGPGAGRAS